MSNTVLAFILAVLGSTTVSTVVVAWINRNKNTAEIQNMNIEGDIKVGESWRDYAIQMKQDMEGMKQELTSLHNKYLSLETKYNTLNHDYAILSEKYAIAMIDLGHRVDEVKTKQDEQ